MCLLFCGFIFIRILLYIWIGKGYILIFLFLLLGMLFKLLCTTRCQRMYWLAEGPSLYTRTLGVLILWFIYNNMHYNMYLMIMKHFIMPKLIHCFVMLLHFVMENLTPSFSDIVTTKYLLNEYIFGIIIFANKLFIDYFFWLFQKENSHYIEWFTRCWKQSLLMSQLTLQYIPCICYSSRHPAS